MRDEVKLPEARCTVQIVDTTGGDERHVKKLTVELSGERALEMIRAALGRAVLTPRGRAEPCKNG